MAEKNYLGCSFAKDKNRWIARISINGESLRLGQFSTAEEAGMAYDYVARKLNRELNFPGKSIPKAIREVVKPKIAKFQLAEKVEVAITAADQKIWNEGEFHGVQWATLNKSLAEKTLSITKKQIQFLDGRTLADFVGCGQIFDEYVTGKIRPEPVKNKNSQLAFVRALLESAQRYFRDEKEERERRERDQASLAKWLADKNKPAGEEVAQGASNEATEAQAAIVVDGNAEPIKASREHLSTLLAELQAKRKEQDADAEFKPVDTGDIVPGTLPQPNGEVWSADCNPVTLAEANAAIADAKKNRTGIFAMMDEIDRERAERKAAEVERLLAEIL